MLFALVKEKCLFSQSKSNTLNGRMLKEQMKTMERMGKTSASDVQDRILLSFVGEQIFQNLLFSLT